MLDAEGTKDTLLPQADDDVARNFDLIIFWQTEKFEFKCR